MPTNWPVSSSDLISSLADLKSMVRYLYRLRGECALYHCENIGHYHGFPHLSQTGHKIPDKIIAVLPRHLENGISTIVKKYLRAIECDKLSRCDRSRRDDTHVPQCGTIARKPDNVFTARADCGFD